MGEPRSAVIMETFYCRKLSADGMRVLMSDYRIVCTDHGGGITSQYLPYLIIGICLTLVWNIGIPVFFTLQLRRHRVTIVSGNMSYAGIAPLRPLFMFFKPDCYMFEIWFMLEKLLLVGVFGIVRVYFGGFFLILAASMVVTTFMLCLIAKKRPSKTDPCPRPPGAVKRFKHPWRFS